MDQHAGYTLRDVFHVLFKRKWLIVLFFIGALGVGSVVEFSRSPTLYEATAQILLSPGRENLLDLTLTVSTHVPPSVSFELEEQSARTIEMLTGRYLSEQLVRSIGAQTLCREPVRWPLRLLEKRFCDPQLSEEILTDRVVTQVQENIHAERVGHAALVNVSFRHQDAALAARAINTLGALYLDRHLGVLKDPRNQTFLQEESELLKQRLAEAGKSLESFKQENGIGSNIKDDRENVLHQLSLLVAQQNEIHAKQAELNGQIAKLKAHGDDVDLTVSDSSPAHDRLVALQLKESEMAVRIGDHNPSLIAVREEIGRAREAQRKELLLVRETELTGWHARELSIQPKITSLTTRLQGLDRLEPDFDHLQQQAQAAQQNYRLYMAKTEESRVASAMDTERIASVRVIDPARPPMQPLNSRLQLKILLTAAFGLFAGLVVAFGLELFGDRLETAERAESALGVPVLTSIPIMRLRANR